MDSADVGIGKQKRAPWMKKCPARKSVIMSALVVLVLAV